METKLSEGSVVDYNGIYFLLWNINSANKAQLIGSEGIKHTGTPCVRNLKLVKKLPVVTFNNCKYAVDKYNRIFSLATGKLVYTTNCPERARLLAEIGRV